MGRDPPSAVINKLQKTTAWFPVCFQKHWTRSCTRTQRKAWGSTRPAWRDCRRNCTPVLNFTSLNRATSATIKETLKPTFKKRSACEAGAQEAPTGFCGLVLRPEGPLLCSCWNGHLRSLRLQGSGLAAPCPGSASRGEPRGSSGVKGGAPRLRQQGQADRERGSWAGTVSGTQSQSTVPRGLGT